LTFELKFSGGGKAGSRARAYGVQGEAESVQPGEEKLKGRPYCWLQLSDHRV